jgi:peptide-methionine (S)-S-oxide reductase
MLLVLGIASAGRLVGAGEESMEKATAVATFAGGCFWCIEAPFEDVPGVRAAVSGYTGGTTANPAYEEVSSGATGHAEAVQVTYDPSQVAYEDLLEVFWRNINPVQAGGQFADHGSQYRTAIFYHDEAQRQAAEASKASLERMKVFDRPIATEILPVGPFYPAEEYHQDFYRKNPVRYKLYKFNCGRAQRLQDLWGNKQ